MSKRLLPILQSAGRVALFLIVLFILALSALAQNDAPTPLDTQVTAPAFDVISIRPSKPSNGWQIGSKADGFSARGVTLWALIYNAYDVRPIEPVAGLPKWADSTQFDIEAKMDESTYTTLEKLPFAEQHKQRQLLLQSLLASRFKLRVHHEAAERPVFDLVVDQGGFKLKPSQSDKGGGWVRGGEIHYTSAPITSLVFTLSNTNDVGRVVYDKTGLTGKYDIDLKWTPDEERTTDDAGPSIFTALKEQIGLKLVPSKGRVDTIVVDYVEHPSEN